MFELYAYCTLHRVVASRGAEEEMRSGREEEIQSCAAPPNRLRTPDSYIWSLNGDE